jgi:DNA-binding MarR family transcriptional regulator
MARKYRSFERTMSKKRDLGLTLLVRARRWERAASTVLAEHGLTVNQYLHLHGLAKLLDAREATTQVRLAEQIDTDVMLTSKTLRSLEALDLIERHEHPTDTRAKVVHLTKDGQALVTKAGRALQRVDDHFFKGLGDL